MNEQRSSRVSDTSVLMQPSSVHSVILPVDQTLVFLQRYLSFFLISKIKREDAFFLIFPSLQPVCMRNKPVALEVGLQ